MTKAGFGEHLKREREMRGVSLEEICGATRIGTRFLEALEKEEWERLPGGVFNRGFVRAVARYLGLDEEGLVAEYGLAMNDQRGTAAAWVNPPAPAKSSKRWLPWIGLAAALVSALAGWLAWRHYSMPRSRRNAGAPAAYTITAPAGALTPGDDSAILAPASSLANAAGLADAAGPAGLAGLTFPNAHLRLQIEAGKTTVVTVSADGNLVFGGSMTAGQKRTFSAASSFDVSTEDSGALLLELNGRTLAPLGPPREPGGVRLTRRDVASAVGGPD